MGCNYGSKNTLDYNYLTRCEAPGRRDPHPLCAVRGFEPRDGGGYVVRYVRHEPEEHRDRPGSAFLDEIPIDTDHLVLSAGALGSTFTAPRQPRPTPGPQPNARDQV